VIDLTKLEHYRLPGHHRHGQPGNPFGGVFIVPCKTSNHALHVIATSGDGWDHVSVSLPSRCPNWMEMEQVKRMFFKDDEIAMQLHVPPSDHINVHPFCLHLWRPHGVNIPLPPARMV
jgi:hypothetical protein